MLKSFFPLLIITLLVGCGTSLPKAAPTGAMGIDKNINEKTIDKYLNRADSVYRDLRLIVDPADFSSIDGDSFLSGFVRGFEVVPFPLISTVDFGEMSFGTPYEGPSLYTKEGDTYKANYVESLAIVKDLFPQDKNIFLMCGGGGYSRDMRNLLIALGWDENKVYNTGGHWYYSGANNVEVRRKVDGVTHYDIWKIPYHDIPFATLTVN